MKKLHPVGVTADNEGLVLSPRKGAKSGGFVVAVDDALLEALELARQRRNGAAAGTEESSAAAAPAVPAAPPRPSSSLSPREIQARLRAGSTIAEVAQQAGVDDEWVQRFAAPILAEQAKVIDTAQRLVLVKARRGPSIEPLGPSVQWNLSDRGVRFSNDVFADCWSAFNLHGARWAVRLTYTSRKRNHVAEWEVDLRERTLAARNRLAADLGHVEEGRRRPSADNEPDAAEAPTAGVVAPAGPATPGPASKAATGRAKGGAGGRAPTAKAGGGRATPAATAKAGSGRAKGSAGVRATPAATAKAGGGRATPGAGTAGARVAKAVPPASQQPRATPAHPKASKARASAVSTAAATRSPAAAKTSGRQPSPRKGQSAKQPPGDSPGAGSPPDLDVDRPSHLARPFSPMKFANKMTSTPIWGTPAPRSTAGRVPGPHGQAERASGTGRSGRPPARAEKPTAGTPAGDAERAAAEPPPRERPARPVVETRPPSGPTVRALRPDGPRPEEATAAGATDAAPRRPAGEAAEVAAPPSPAKAASRLPKPAAGGPPGTTPEGARRVPSPPADRPRAATVRPVAPPLARAAAAAPAGDDAAPVIILSTPRAADDDTERQAWLEAAERPAAAEVQPAGRR
ncbi:MAG TPA: septation protein SepH [Acidimicrobiales bacterium]|nr:septation protein SepH [Acidimicrobiales bacterium]